MLINKEQICSIHIYDFQKADLHFWKNYQPSKKSWFFKTDEVLEGVFKLDLYSKRLFSYRVHNWEDKFVIIDGLVKYKPRIIIKMINDNTKAISFDTIEERDTYINTHFNTTKYLKIYE